MPNQRQFTMEDLQRLVGEGDQDNAGQPATEANPYQPPPPVPVPRNIRGDIYDAVYSSGGWVNRKQIADALQLKKSDWLIRHIDQLVDEGYLLCEKVEMTNGLKERWYYINRNR